MSCLLVTPNEELLFNKAISQTRTLRFHKLSKLLKNKSRELMAKFLGFFRKSNEEDLTMKTVDDFIAGLNTTTSRPNTWPCYPIVSSKCNPCEEMLDEDDWNYDADCEGESFDDGCCCEGCQRYREECCNDKKKEYIESEYSIRVECESKEWYPNDNETIVASRRRRGKLSVIKEECKPSEPKKWYEKGAIVLPF